jgi:hypothetical protein
VRGRLLRGAPTSTFARVPSPPATLHEPTSHRHRPLGPEAVGPALAPAASLPSGCEGRNTSTRQPKPVGPASVQRADERTRTADLLITSALLAIWVQPNGLLAELRPSLPNASTEATLNGLLVGAPTHRCRKTRKAPPLFFRHAPLPVAKSDLGSVRCGT